MYTEHELLCKIYSDVEDYEDLEKLVFNCNKSFSCDELLIISGYVGPSPVHQLKNMPFNTNIIYGMYGSEDYHFSGGK